MKQAILLHGSGGSDKDYFWFADTKKYLEKLGYTVWWPLLPRTKQPKLEETVEFVRDNIPSTDENTLVIAHSSACPLTLSLLQRGLLKAKQAVLVAGYYVPIGDDISSLMLERDEYDWERIKASVGSITLINSDNDPWKCDDKQARPVAERLGANFIFAEGEGHMGSNSFNQPYKEHRLVKEVLEMQ